MRLKFSGLADERQAGLIAQVVGQLLEDEIGHNLLHLLGGGTYGAKLLILKEKCREAGVWVTDSGTWHLLTLLDRRRCTSDFNPPSKKLINFAPLEESRNTFARRVPTGR